MTQWSNEVLATLLFFLLVCSAFFSSSETGMMSINRYRLRHLVRHNFKPALRVQHLLEKPERLLGLILAGNNFVNLWAAAIATTLAIRLFGEASVTLATVCLTVVVLIFAEMTPKTWAAWYPEKVAFLASWILKPLLTLLYYPIILPINGITTWLLRMLGVNREGPKIDPLSQEELRTVVVESGTLISTHHQSMLLGILDLEKVTVDDAMIPRKEVEGIDLSDEWEEIVKQIQSCKHSRALVYRENIDNIVGILSLRTALNQLIQGHLTKENLTENIKEPYFVPEGTHLHRQLRHFQQKRDYMALVVDEYGDFQGIITLSDILDEIVGFESDETTETKLVQPQEDGSILVDGSYTIRDLNRAMHWHLPIDGPNTLNGLIMEYLERIPMPGTQLELAGHQIEVLYVKNNQVKTLKIFPPKPQKEPKTE